MTLYNPVTNAFALLDVPSNAFLKLCGFSSSGILMWPASAAHPEIDIKSRIASLKRPRAFCRRRPHLRKQPWRTSANVTPAMPIARWFH